MVRNIRSAACWMLVTVTAVLPVWAQRDEAVQDRTLSPYFQVNGETEGATGTFPLASTDVTALLNGIIAEVTVVQAYKNEGTVPINGKYVFPMSTRAAVHGMSMQIGKKRVIAKVKEREAAKQEFEEAQAAGKSASLLEQQRPNVFTMSVSNIMPGDRVIIELHYTEFITPEEGTYEFVFPTVVGPRYSHQNAETAPASELWVQSPYLHATVPSPSTFSFRATLSTGIPLQELVCTTHKTAIDWKNESTVDVLLDGTEHNGGNRDLVLRYRLRGRKVQSGLLLYEDEHEKFFQLTVQPPERVAAASVLPREYVFIVDVSGSMNGFPLNVSKRLMRDLIGNLNREDLINVVLFSGTSSILADHSLPATAENCKKAISFIDHQQGGGGTELTAALERAFALPTDERYSRNFVVVTDGFIGEERESFSLIRRKLDRANVFAFGIGSSVNRYLIEGIAKAGLGEPFVILNADEAPKIAKQFRAYITSPLLSDISVKADGVKLYGMQPEKVPDLMADRPLVLFGKYDGSPNGVITISGRSGEGPWRTVFRMGDVQPSAVNQPLRYLWARTLVATIDDFAEDGGSDENVREVTNLGLTYNLLTSRTSFIAVLDEVRNTSGTAKNVQQPLPLPQGVSEFAVGGGDKVPEPGIVEMALLLGTILLVGRSHAGRTVRKC